MSSTTFTGFAVFDLETTGFSPAKHHRIIELGIVRLDENLEVVETWETLINPDRDIGATDIHGLTAADLRDAPSFADLQADIWHRFEGAIPVAHNFSFDRSFLLAEFMRTGIDIGQFDGLCTMQLANQLKLAPGVRRLVDLCSALKLELSKAHSAGNDATMCANLLKCMAQQIELACLKQPVSCRTLWKRQATPLGITRQKAREMAINSPLQNLSKRIGQLTNDTAVDDTAIDEYLNLLDWMLEDRQIDESEAEELAEFARENGFTAADLEKVHYRFLSSMVALVLSDGIVTEDERRDLNRVAGLLGIDRSEVDRLLLENPEYEQFSSEDLSGQSVCFTGALRCCIDGERMDKKKAEALADYAGLIPKNSVTKSLDLLVVVDPDSLSGKAKKARQYGTRILTERVFWQKLGIQAD